MEGMTINTSDRMRYLSNEIHQILDETIELFCFNHLISILEANKRVAGRTKLLGSAYFIVELKHFIEVLGCNRGATLGSKNDRAQLNAKALPLL